MGIGDWGLGVGGLGCGAHAPTHQPTTQTPKPQNEIF